MSAERSTGSAALGFVLLSGLGWLLDTGLYVLLVALGVRVLLASILGGLCGATFAFLTSSRFIFLNGNRVSAKLVAYLAYTLALILGAAWIVEYVTGLLVGLSQLWGYGVPLTTLAFLAKCLITPFLLATNFVVVRSMLHRPGPLPGR